MMLGQRIPVIVGCILLGTVVLLGGCRTYGGFESEAATYNQIQQANQRFAEDLERARAELSTLESASEPFLGVVAARYGRIVEAHAAVLDEHTQLAERLSAGSSHRALHRAFGAIVVEQRVLRSQYRELLEYVYDAFMPDTARTAAAKQPYALIPPFYDRISAPSRPVTVNELLRRVRSSPTSVPDLGLPMPPAEEPAGHGDDEPHGASEAGGASAGGHG